MLMAETTEVAKEMFAGVPTLELLHTTSNYLQVWQCLRQLATCAQFGGRILVTLMFLTTMEFDSVPRIIFDVAGIGAQ